MWNLGDIPVLTSGGAKAEYLPWSGLPCHVGYNAGRTCVPDAVQNGGIQRHQNLYGHDGRIPSSGLVQTGRGRCMVCGSLL